MNLFAKIMTIVAYEDVKQHGCCTGVPSAGLSNRQLWNVQISYSTDSYTSQVTVSSIIAVAYSVAWILFHKVFTHIFFSQLHNFVKNECYLSINLYFVARHLILLVESCRLQVCTGLTVKIAVKISKVKKVKIWPETKKLSLVFFSALLIARNRFCRPVPERKQDCKFQRFFTVLDPWAS